MQHQLKRTSNRTILGLSGNVPIQPPVLGSNKHTPHEGESRDITTTILQHRQSSDYNMFRSSEPQNPLCRAHELHKNPSDPFLSPFRLLPTPTPQNTPPLHPQPQQA